MAIDYKVTLLPEAKEYIREMPEAGKKKMTRNIDKVKIGTIRDDWFEKLDNEIWEIKADIGDKFHRLLCFYDKMDGRLIVATHGFDKKTNKTPPSEIERAKAIKRQYEAQNK